MNNLDKVVGTRSNTGDRGVFKLNFFNFKKKAKSYGLMKILMIFFVSAFCDGVLAAKLESVAVEQKNGKTTIFCALSASIPYHVFSLTQPERVVVDFDQTNTILDLRKIQRDPSVVTAMRVGYPKPNILRLVFDVKQRVSIHASLWHVAGHPFGLRIDLNPVANISVIKPSTARLTTSSTSLTSVTRPVLNKHAPTSMRDIVVVIDPGHGGKDPGAMGAHRNAEKDVVLSIALKLKQMIDRQPGMRAVLTRKGDYYVGLRERLNIARQYNADIFIAIHADAFINQHSNGASVFALSQRGATSEAARWLAEKENYSELGGVNLSGLDDQSGMIRTVLLDLSQTATINAGLQMGASILQQLSKITTLHNRKVEQARFVVLKSPDTPSVLVETGFISNPEEERNLTSYAYQTRLSQAIFEGVKHYFWEHPIQGTRLEAMQGRNSRLLSEQTHQSWFSSAKRRLS